MNKEEFIEIAGNKLKELNEVQKTYMLGFMCAIVFDKQNQNEQVQEGDKVS